MSCNGCRVLRKGCSEDCMLRESIEWIESPRAQANATLFVVKFFGRATLMSFISSAPHNRRPSMFQSLLYEAVGRIVNPVNGAVGLLWTGNWHLCQAAVETVLRGGGIEPLSEIQQGGMLFGQQESNPKDMNSSSGSFKTMNNTIMRKDDDHISTKKAKFKATDLNLSLTYMPEENQRTEASTSVVSETTTVGSSGSRKDEQFQLQQRTGRSNILRLFV